MPARGSVQHTYNGSRIARRRDNSLIHKNAFCHCLGKALTWNS